MNTEYKISTHKKYYGLTTTSISMGKEDDVHYHRKVELFKTFESLEDLFNAIKLQCTLEN